MTRLANLPNNVQRHIQALLVRNDGQPNNRALAMLAVANRNFPLSTETNVTGLRNAFAFTTAAGNVLRERHMRGPGFDWRAGLRAVTDRFGYPPFKYVTGSNPNNEDTFVLMYIGVLKNAGSQDALPTITFADNAKVAVAFKVSHRHSTDNKDVRFVLQYRDRDLVFFHKFHPYAFQYMPNNTPKVVRYTNAYASHAKQRVLDVPRLRAIVRCMMDMVPGSQNAINLHVKIHRNPAATTEAVRALADVRSVAVSRVSLPDFLE